MWLGNGKRVLRGRRYYVMDGKPKKKKRFKY